MKELKEFLQSLHLGENPKFATSLSRLHVFSKMKTTLRIFSEKRLNVCVPMRADPERPCQRQQGLSSTNWLWTKEEGVRHRALERGSFVSFGGKRGFQWKQKVAECGVTDLWVFLVGSFVTNFARQPAEPCQADAF